MNNSIDELNIKLPANSKLDIDNQTLIEKIIDESDSKEVKDLVNQFNLNHTKKQIVRSAIFDQLLDHITDQMQERIIQRGDQFSNKDLLDYLNTINASIEKTQKQISDVDAIPVIQVNQQNNINIAGADILDRESRERVTSVIEALMSKINSPDFIQNNLSEEVDSGEIAVYNNDNKTENIENNSSTDGVVEETDSTLDNLFNSEEDDNI